MKAWKKINGGQKPYVIPTLYDNGTIGGSTFACACETNSSYAHQFFEGYYDVKSTFGDWIEWYYPMSVGCLVTDFQLHFMDDVTANGRLEARVNDTWITVGTFSVSNYYVANITFSGTQYYSQRYRLVFENCSPSDPAINLYLMTQNTSVDAYKVMGQEVTKYYKYDTTRPTYNYTPVGTPINTNGILSDFSSSNYATIVPTFTPDTNPWEIVFKFTTGSNVSSEQYIFASMYGSSGKYSGIYFEIKSGQIKMEGSTNGSSYNISTGWGTTTILANITYWVKGVFDGSTYKFYLSTDGINFTQQGNTVSNSNGIKNSLVTRIGTFGNATSYPFYGTIDLTESYIKINGNKWWQGVTYPVIPGTSTDYDFYKDETVYQAVKF